jgi:orotidine 5'-phosphate decarboxylase subfamily 2
MSRPLERYLKAVEAKSSVLCVGIDPDPETHPQTDEKLSFCLWVLDEVAEYSAAVKVNENFVRDFSLDAHIKLTRQAEKHGLVTIYDCKIGDIDSTNRAGLMMARRLGYDFITFNPVLGNLQSMVKHSKSFDVGVLALLHPSNPESRRYYRAFMADGRMLYEHLLEEIAATEVEGVVLGLHPDLADEEIQHVRKAVGDEKIILFPGVGQQGGDPLKAVTYGGQRILVNVGRTIIQSTNPRQKAAEIAEKLRFGWKAV